MSLSCSGFFVYICQITVKNTDFALKFCLLKDENGVQNQDKYLNCGTTIYLIAIKERLLNRLE